MKISESEKLNMSIVHGSRAYEQWEQDHHLPDYLVVIMYELLLREKLTQKQLVNLSDLPKQSINKGIKRLHEAGYLDMTIDPDDKRVRFCELTDKGKSYAQEKLASLFDLEEKTAQKLGPEKMKLLTSLNEEWSNTFWQFLNEERGN
ncbi:MarR family winged helix-turn-helix transcriptional regulator [Lactobacillus ultunensis]|uniref:Transcriptional regulator, MarR family n=1 Tax=Lactobacillus ultunensis DSM 16047 TaxID=525365 RepID=C2ELQ3_9LACO|nr:helix-turn-helix domain-containing protein [Lactobacillus ultunensis]EEJ72548.1 transcriptional regulator, MarR family [Lactobacillus ultunensis DSM 16047]KRL80559.1 transcriptional regulator [Lactobacillus ultunensis DSM 16047]QQP28118.1 MarR family transcriptional regulator [Lactobacillus ultunensis]